MNICTRFWNAKSSACSKEQTVTESTHDATMKWVDSCETCIEDGKKLCKCGNDNADKDELRFEVKNESNDAHDHLHEANSSFLHSVINMIGMLIGIYL